MSKQNILLSTNYEDSALRSGDFRLLPVNPKAPIIQSHPIRNFTQRNVTEVLSPFNFTDNTNSSYTEGFGTDSNSQPLLLIIPIFNVFTVKKNISIEWTMYIIDPSNINNPNDLSNIKYVWKRNGNPIVELNRINDNKGTPQVLLDEQSVTQEVAGEYVCEVSNDYGTVTTVPFILEVIDPDNNSMMYADLVTNGDGGGGLDGWLDVTGTYQTRMIEKNEFVGLDSTIADFTVATGSLEQKSYPFNFNTFSRKNIFYPVYAKLLAAQPNLTDLNTQIVYSDNNTPIGLTDYEWWNHTTALPTIIANEDIDNPKSPQGFFPGPAYIDSFNDNNDALANKNLKTLADELDYTTVNIPYFTTNRAQFLTPGKSARNSLRQVIDLSSVSSVIDGAAAGIQSIAGCFFAYVGIAISRYVIKYVQNGDQKEVNWYVTDIGTYRDFLQCKLGDKFRIKPDKGTSIECTPIIDDIVEINLKYYNESGDLISSAPVQTPTSRDLWAIKEKAFFPLTLYPLFAFFEPNNNDITVFGRTYTTTDALLPLFKNSKIKNIVFEAEIAVLKTNIETLNETLELNTLFEFNITQARRIILQSDMGSGDFSQNELSMTSASIDLNLQLLDNWKSSESIYRADKAQLEFDLRNKEANKDIFYGISAMHPDNIQQTAQTPGLDRNAAFFLSRYGSSFLKSEKIYPTEIWEPKANFKGDVWYENLTIEGNKYKALTDPGASAFFAVSLKNVLIAGTRLVEIEIITENKSPAMLDEDPSSKGWNSDELYNSLFNVSSTDPLTGKPSQTKNPLHTYREPRCAITKIKYQLQPFNVYNNTNLDQPSSNLMHVTYDMPVNTVLNTATTEINTYKTSTAEPGDFVYKLIMPQNITIKPDANTLSEKDNEQLNNIIENIENGPTSNSVGTKVPPGYYTTSSQAIPATIVK